MPCYHPIPASQDKPGDQPRLHPPLGTANLALPCGKCLGCRSARAQQWANRCSHEARLYQDNIFLTLTYDDGNLPDNGYLDPLALTRFIKRLRKRAADRSDGIASDPDRPIRYFACGEYGEHNGRPHYHAILFNLTFSDRYRVGKDLYTSHVLRALWPLGRAAFGTATAASANYIAQYNLKKQDQGDHDADGVYRPPPFLRMSLKPAIGSQWLTEYQNDLQHGYLVAQNFKQAIPRTYLSKLKDLNPSLHEDISIRKAQQITKNLQKTITANDPERVKASEIIHHRLKQQTESRNL
jgi:hypothetical protein